MNVPGPEIGELAADIREVLLSAGQIQARVDEMGRQISNDYRGGNPLLVGVLKGVVFFMADLLRAITIPVEVDFLQVSTYSSQNRSSGIVKLTKDLDTSIRGRHVLFVEDVIDTGLKLNYLLQVLRTREPASLEVCVLLDKPEHRLINIPLKYRGFELPEKFVVGYGLGHREKYRNLPFVGLPRPSVLLDPAD